MSKTSNCTCNVEHLCLPHYTAGQGVEAVTSLALSLERERDRIRVELDKALRALGPCKHNSCMALECRVVHHRAATT